MVMTAYRKLLISAILIYSYLHSQIFKYKTKQQNIIFYILRPLSKKYREIWKYGKIHSSQANQVAHLFTC